ncbi:MAG: hypothetical protein IJU69_00250 [Bacteroidales bacterium]|nr:hypothetical protein [Bacteroidales bacterium]
MKSKWVIVLVSAALLIGLLSGIFIHRGYALKHSLSVRRDTVTVWKTVEVIRPEPVESHQGGVPISLPKGRFIVSDKDSTTLQALPDILTFKGTLEDSVSYKAVVSGLQPALESLTLSYPSRTITNTVTIPYKGWDMAVKADAFCIGRQDFSAFFFTGIEFAYNAGPFHIGIDTGCLENYSASQGGWQFAPYAGASLKIELFQFN